MQEGKKLVRAEGGNGGDIVLRFISKWSKVDSAVASIEDLISEIERLKPDAVILDVNLYDTVGGVEIKRKLEDRFEIPVWYE